jgi:hypothetical protein
MATAKVQLSDGVRQIIAAQQRLDSDRPTVLQRIGVQLLSLSQLAYREKARGGTGSDGITWAKLSRKTIEVRVRSRAPAKRIVAQRRDLAKQIKALKGPGSNAKRARLVQRRKDLAAKLQSLVDTEYSRHEIGVDTGLQRSSAQPGFAAPDGKGGNVLDVSPQAVTVGYAREYSKYFDEKRPLFPETLPDAWEKQIEQTVEKWATEILQRELDNGL